MASLQLVVLPRRVVAQARGELVERTGGRVGAVNVGALQARAAVPGEMHGLGESAVRLAHLVARGPGDVLSVGHTENLERKRIDEAAYLALIDQGAAIRMQVIEQAFSVVRQKSVQIHDAAQA